MTPCEWVLAEAGAKKAVVLCVVVCAAKNTGNALIEVTLSPRVEGGTLSRPLLRCLASVPLHLRTQCRLPSAQCNLYLTFPLGTQSLLTSVPRHQPLQTSSSAQCLSSVQCCRYRISPH